MNQPPDVRATAWHGTAIAVAILTVWCGSLAALLLHPAAAQPLVWLPAVAWMTFWSTGLFITAHDAMHGTVHPTRPVLNRRIGAIAAGLYAAFGLQALTLAHRRHHADPASPHDPDFHDGAHPHPVRWYVHFMRHYLTWRQLLIMAAAFNILSHGVWIAEPRLLGFWVLPVCLSTVQLFWFGTYRPHRHGAQAADEHRAVSSGLPPWVSLLACFHFDYHWEHHRWPHLAWWQLSAARWRSP